MTMTIMTIKPMPWTDHGGHDDHAHHPNPRVDPERPANAHLYFGIYYTMTGLHGAHVIIGMIVIAWLFLRGMRGDFSAKYFTPVDLGGLYWHVVDLIWIFLFPLLYLGLTDHAHPIPHASVHGENAVANRIDNPIDPMGHFIHRTQGIKFMDFGAVVAGQHRHGLFFIHPESAVDHFGVCIVFTLGLDTLHNAIGQHVKIAGLEVQHATDFHQILQNASLFHRSGDAIKQQHLFFGLVAFGGNLVVEVTAEDGHGQAVGHQQTFGGVVLELPAVLGVWVQRPEHISGGEMEKSLPRTQTISLCAFAGTGVSKQEYGVESTAHWDFEHPSLTSIVSSA